MTHPGPITKAEAVPHPKESIAKKPLLSWWLFLIYGASACALFYMKLRLIGTCGNATPFFDQWQAEGAHLYKPFLDGTLAWPRLFAFHNEHILFTTSVLALALLNLNGLWSPLLQMVVNAGLHTVAVIFSIVLLSHSVGRRYAPALLAFSLILFGIPYAWENSLIGMQELVYFVFLFGVACLWLTTTGKPFSARWWSGAACALLGYFSFASGILVLAAATVLALVFYASGLRKTRNQWIAGVFLGGAFILGAMQTPSLPYHVYLRATSFSHFTEAWIKVLSWPVHASFFSALIRNAPALVFAGYLLWKRPPAEDRRWFLFALILWGIGSATSIAYGRAKSPLEPRYLDDFAFFILVNFACLISILKNSFHGKRFWKIMGAGTWTLTLLISLGYYAYWYLPDNLTAKRENGIIQEINTRNYLRTGDPGHLKKKRFLQVPFPDPKWLASILASPAIRGILPTCLRDPQTSLSFESQPDGTFIPKGFSPATPERGDSTWGSYNAQGNVAEGRALIRFAAPPKNLWLALPVAGYPRNAGMSIEIEQNGHRSPLVIKENPEESWGVIYTRVGDGPFSILLTDSSPTAWLAIGAPAAAGRLDPFINVLLGNKKIWAERKVKP